ncbi:hypothetical protein Taro_006837 [Colocasia esculenta]|uniref:Uncharacterized protein n=1 Tax=Colocasia esculenta TaxID=4460 RepID=A0A843TTT2_COLES|nr:hypothetical protein [Colocasia esculenta]
MEATRAGMPVVSVRHNSDVNGPALKDIHMENFTVSVGGRDLIEDATVTLSFGRHYGEWARDERKMKRRKKKRAEERTTVMIMLRSLPVLILSEIE